jgi:hypothetical protein
MGSKKQLKEGCLEGPITEDSSSNNKRMEDENATFVRDVENMLGIKTVDPKVRRSMAKNEVMKMQRLIKVKRDQPEGTHAAVVRTGLHPGHGDTHHRLQTHALQEEGNQTKRKTVHDVKS